MRRGWRFCSPNQSSQLHYLYDVCTCDHILTCRACTFIRSLASKATRLRAPAPVQRQPSASANGHPARCTGGTPNLLRPQTTHSTSAHSYWDLLPEVFRLFVDRQSICLPPDPSQLRGRYVRRWPSSPHRPPSSLPPLARHRPKYSTTDTSPPEAQTRTATATQDQARKPGTKKEVKATWAQGTNQNA